MEKFPKPRIEKPGSNPEYRAKRERIFETIPNSIEGIDTERIESFVQKEGLRSIPYLFIREANITKLREITNEQDWFAIHDNGLYNTSLDMTVILRDEKLESLNGAAYSEGLLMHELGHASAGWVQYVTRMVDDGHEKIIEHNQRRSGFSSIKNVFGETPSHHGQYLEEGFAQMFCTRYMSQNMGEPARQKLALMCEMDPNDDVPNLKISIAMDDGAKLNTTPANLYVSEQGPTLAVAAYAQAGLQTLWNSVSTLENTMRKSRTHTESMLEIPRLINSVEPGLYSFLNNLPYTRGDFAVGTERIQAILGST